MVAPAQARPVAGLGVDDVVDVGLETAKDVVGLALGQPLVGHGLVEVGLRVGDDRVLQPADVLALRLGHVGQRLTVVELGAQIALAEAQVLGRRGQRVADARLEQAAADKKLTQSQADDIYDALKSHIDDIVDANVKLDLGGRGGLHIGFGFGADTAAAAKYLGLDESALRDKLRSGQSLADVAKAQNKDVQGLEDAIVASQKARLDQAVSDKKLTQSQADDVLTKLKSHVDDLVNAKPPDRPALRGRRGAGPRFFFGP